MDKKILQKSEYFQLKIIQLYQMIIVRHGLMVVGDPYSGKTTMTTVLQESLNLMNQRHGEENKVNQIRLNPKSVKSMDLYGEVDMATNEWNDGLIPVLFKQLSNDTSVDRKWLVFDGPVDALWIENMNTVLDDNKKLCLANGDIFYMGRNMNIIFEPKDLLVASPATVSRCGMIYCESAMLSYDPYYFTWTQRLKQYLKDFDLNAIDIYY